MLNSSAQPTTAPRTVLVVEDEPTLATAIAQRITAEGWTARVASDGASAVQAATTLRPDLVIMDIMLPVMDGLEATKRIVAERPVPVLILTARDDEADKVIGLGAGADDYMTKPFSMRELIARCKALLRRVDRAKVIAKNSEIEKLLDFGVFGDDLGTIYTAQQRLATGDEFAHGERLGHVVIGSGTEADDLIGLVVSCRQDQHWHRALRHDAFRGLKTIHHGQHDVHDDQIRTQRSRGLNRTGAVGCHARRPAFRCDALRDGSGQCRLVFDHQNGAWSRCGLC